MTGRYRSTSTGEIPGFFAWVITPGRAGIAKVGAAGFGVNSFKTLDSFLAGKAFKVLTKVAAPIYVGGQVEEFVSGRERRSS